MTSHYHFNGAFYTNKEIYWKAIKEWIYFKTSKRVNLISNLNDNLLNRYLINILRLIVLINQFIYGDKPQNIDTFPIFQSILIFSFFE